MCSHTHTGVHTHAHTGTHVHTGTHAYVFTHMITPSRTHTLVHTNVFTHMLTHRHKHTCLHTCPHTDMFRHRRTHVFTHAHTRVHKHMLAHRHKYMLTHMHQHTRAPTYAHTQAHTCSHTGTPPQTHPCSQQASGSRPPQPGAVTAEPLPPPGGLSGPCEHRSPRYREAVPRAGPQAGSEPGPWALPISGAPKTLRGQLKAGHLTRARLPPVGPRATGTLVNIRAADNGLEHRPQARLSAFPR